MFDGSADARFAADDGSADPAAAAALAAFAAGRGSEQAALTALAAVRFLVPVVATLTDEAAGADGPAPSAGPVSATHAAAGRGTATRAPATACHPPARRAAVGGPAPAGEKASEMALPALVGQDGRRAIPVFTGLAALASWQPSARPIPVDAAQVWQAAMQDGCAVVIDIAGPVPLAVEGDRLAALAASQPVPPPHEDTDVRDAVARAVVEAAAAAGIDPRSVGFALRPGADGTDLIIEVASPRDLAPAAAEHLAAQAGAAAMASLGARLRRGIAVTLAR